MKFWRPSVGTAESRLAALAADRRSPTAWDWLWIAPLLLIAGLQTFLVFREPVFSPVDELQHVDYVRSIAEDGHPPVFGVTQVDPKLLALYAHARSLTPAEEARVPWTTRLSYEALQFPAFYLLAAPIYRLLDGNLVAAVYALRLLNALLAVGLVYWMLRLVGLVLGNRWLPPLVALAVLLIPQVSSRSSQVNNEVLCALLATVLLYRVAKREAFRADVALDRRRALVDGLTGGLATVTKVTAIVLAAPVLLAWHWLPGGLPRRLAAGALGALLPLVLWLAWSLPTYGGPFPWSGSRLRLFPSAPTTTAQAWFHLGNHLVNGLWLPYEWDPAHQWLNLTVVVTAGATIVFLAALVVGTISAFLDRLTVEGRGASLAVVTIGAFLVGYAVFELSRRRSIYGSDPRELYAFVGALGILLAALVRRLGDLAGGILCALAIGAWLAVDVGLYLFGSCPRCP